MPSEIILLQATRQHRPFIETLLAAEKLPERLANFSIAQDQSGIVGVIGLELYPPYGLLRSLAVSSSHRNHGIGNILIQAVEQQAADLGLTAIYLLTETAVSYFEKRGYKIVERDDTPSGIRGSSEFSHVCPVSAIVMKKTLSK